MKEIVQHKYGSPDDVLAFTDIDRPVVNDHEVLVRVHAASVHPDIWHVVTGRPYVLRILGSRLCQTEDPYSGNRCGWARRGGRHRREAVSARR